MSSYSYCTAHLNPEEYHHVVSLQQLFCFSGVPLFTVKVDYVGIRHISGN